MQALGGAKHMSWGSGKDKKKQLKANWSPIESVVARIECTICKKELDKGEIPVREGVYTLFLPPHSCVKPEKVPFWRRFWPFKKEKTNGLG